MRHNVKTPLWTAAALLALAWPAFAAGPETFDVTVEDLAAAGVADAVEVETSGDRFAPPVNYFRSSETLSAGEAKKDCSDCADLIAVYAAETGGAPGWYGESTQFIKMGGRLQVRAYIPSTKRIVTVTAVSEATARKISTHLVAKFSK